MSRAIACRRPFRGGWVGVAEPVPRGEVRVVHDYVSVGDVALVVVVVDDGHLEVREALLGPAHGELPQVRERDPVARVGGEHVVLVGPGGPPAVRGVVAVGAPRLVHGHVPVEASLDEPRLARGLVHPREVQKVPGERPSVPLEVPPRGGEPRVPRYGLDRRHAGQLQRKTAGLSESLATSSRRHPSESAT